ncbi:MAG: LysR family transcriptional regulator [Myxococcales bacterium]|nr:LysR family transcriptional regulator [Myxococcales bacterium]
MAVAAAGSFTAAARELRLAKSVVSQHVRTLEGRCGGRLIERSTRRLHLTQIGEHVFDCARAVLASVKERTRNARRAPSFHDIEGTCVARARHLPRSSSSRGLRARPCGTPTTSSCASAGRSPSRSSSAGT